MDERQSRLLTWMAGVLVVLIAALLFLEPSDPGEDDGVWTPLAEDLSADEIEGIQLTGGEESITLERGADGLWHITAPMTLPADQDAASRLSQTLAEVECGEEIADELSMQFGLAPPRAEVRISSSSSSSGGSTALLIGSETPTGWSSYISCGDDGVVRTARSSLAEVEAALGQLRDRHVIAEMQPRRVEIDRGGTRLSLSSSEGTWTTRSGLRADAGAVEALLRELSELEADRFDAPPLDEEVVTITLSDEENSVVIVQGANGSISSGWQPTPLAVARSLEELVPEESALLDDLLFSLEGAAEISVDVDGQRIKSAEKVDGAWEEGWAELLAVAAVDRTAAVGDEEDRMPWAVITIAAPDGREQQLHVQKIDGGKLIAADLDGGAPYLLPEEVASIIPTR